MVILDGGRRGTGDNVSKSTTKTISAVNKRTTHVQGKPHKEREREEHGNDGTPISVLLLPTVVGIILINPVRDGVVPNGSRLLRNESHVVQYSTRLFSNNGWFGVSVVWRCSLCLM